MKDALLWLGLFSATAGSDYLAARWADAKTRVRRANISAIHELVTAVAAFTVYALYQRWTLIVPCVVGAWVGSFLAGVRER